MNEQMDASGFHKDEWEGGWEGPGVEWVACKLRDCTLPKNSNDAHARCPECLFTFPLRTFKTDEKSSSYVGGTWFLTDAGESCPLEGQHTLIRLARKAVEST